MLISQLPSTKTKQKSPKRKLTLEHPNTCIICSNTKCQQSTDHQYINFKNFKELALQARKVYPQLELAKNRTYEFYRKIYRDMKEVLENECLRSRQKINQYYYHHLGCLRPAQIRIMSEVLEDDSRSLPAKKMWGIVVALRDIVRDRSSGNEIVELKAIKQVLGACKEIENRIDGFNFDEFRLKIRKELPRFEEPYENDENLTASTLNWSKSSRFSQSCSSEEEAFQWQNQKLTKLSKKVSLSAKKISDIQMLLNLPKLQHFSTILEFDARRNLITPLSCIAITNFLPQLISLDLRSNKISDTGLQKLRPLLSLKQLMVDDNALTNKGAQHLLQGFPELELLSANENKMTEKGAFILYEKESLKIVWLAGNCVDRGYFGKLKGMWVRKGIIQL